MDKHFKRDSVVILKFIFNKVCDDIGIEFKLEKCDGNTTISEKLCAVGWISEEERQSVISCVTHSAKIK